ncbi:MAG: glucokinase [Stagnimonas sp.]|nr:glucokinase [Stagnimonas sp.]
MATDETDARGFRLVADLGGTNLRMALAEPATGKAELRAVEVLATADSKDLADSLASYWCRQGAPPLSSVVIGVAGPVEGEGRSAQAQLTNAGLRISAEAVAHVFGVPRVLLVNDFAAIAAAAPLLSGFDLQPHGREAPPYEEATVVLGPGTGLGVAAWLPGGRVVAGEGGHARLAPPDQAAVPIWNRLAERYGYVSAELVLSGPGLWRLYQVVADLREVAATAADPAEVWQEAKAGHLLAREAVWHFTASLGAFAGDLALIFGARGLLLAGGILPRWAEDFDSLLFRTAFEAREPSYQARLAAVPSATVIHPYPALLGLAGSFV